jgi:hypothetical protein
MLGGRPLALVPDRAAQHTMILPLPFDDLSDACIRLALCQGCDEVQQVRAAACTSPLHSGRCCYD